MRDRMGEKAENIRKLMGLMKVLVVEDEHYSRKVIRTLLAAVGCTRVYEASDGVSGLEAIVTVKPDIVLLDWEMPTMNGADFMRHVRCPARFPYPDVPVIMLSGHGERSRVLEAVDLGVHEFLLKPVSSNALLKRMLVVMTKPRTMVRRGDYYGPEPRKLSTYKPETEYRIDGSPGELPTYMIFTN
jgi:CheY-like chemotaxis protein